MRIDKDKLAALAALPDDRLWAEILSVATAHGIKLSPRQPSPEEMRRLRGAMMSGARINLAEAMRVINEHNKRGGTNG